MITREDIIRTFTYLDSPWIVSLEKKDLDIIEDKLNKEVRSVQIHVNNRIDSSILPVRLEHIFKKNPENYLSNERAFLQTFALTVSDEIRAMVYFITMEDADIVELKMDYVSQKSFLLKVKLELKSGKKIDFSSDSIWDAEVVRHFGVMMMSGKPIFTGYFPI